MFACFHEQHQLGIAAHVQGGAPHRCRGLRLRKGVLLWGAAQGRGSQQPVVPLDAREGFGRENLQERVGQVAGYFSTGPGGPSHLDLLNLLQLPFLVLCLPLKAFPLTQYVSSSSLTG